MKLVLHLLMEYKRVVRQQTQRRCRMPHALHFLSWVFGALWSLLLLPSCASEPPVQPKLPVSAAFNKDAGCPGPLVVMVGLRSGEKLPFLLDTGAPVTSLDKSLVPRLGKRLCSVTAVNFGDEYEVDVYAAPQLYMGSVPLAMIGTNVVVYDLSRAWGSKGPRPYVGILGMHVLLNYCIQLDFTAHRMRFLPNTVSDKRAWGTPFPLVGLGDGCVVIEQNALGVAGPPSLIDTGYRSDGFLMPELFHCWTNQATLAQPGQARFPDARLGGESYPDALLRAESFITGEPPRQFNGIGLRLLARHLVTFDFPHQTMYLKRTRLGPLVDKASQSVANDAGRHLDRLRKRGQLPGWSRKDEFANATETIQLYYPNAVLFKNVRKKGDASLYHYEFSRAAQDQPWTLQKAWRTDQHAATLEEYPVR